MIDYIELYLLLLLIGFKVKYQSEKVVLSFFVGFKENILCLRFFSCPRRPIQFFEHFSTPNSLRQGSSQIFPRWYLYFYF